MSYQAFATLYDALMEEAPYDSWIDYAKQSIGREHFRGLNVLDVGCGTGELMIRLHEQGADVAGVDLSANMLTIAREKFQALNVEPLLFEQSMDEMDDLGKYDLVTIFCDSLNYLRAEEQIAKTFQRVYDLLEEGGYLLFDVHSLYKIEQQFIGQTFAEEGEELSYIWTSFAGAENGSVEHELAFFVLDDDGKYSKYEELHYQRTYSPEQYKKWLIEAGFQVESITADFTNEAPTEMSERIFFCVKK